MLLRFEALTMWPDRVGSLCHAQFTDLMCSDCFRLYNTHCELGGNNYVHLNTWLPRTPHANELRRKIKNRLTRDQMLHLNFIIVCRLINKSNSLIKLCATRNDLEWQIRGLSHLERRNAFQIRNWLQYHTTQRSILATFSPWKSRRNRLLPLLQFINGFDEKVVYRFLTVLRF